MGFVALLALMNLRGIKESGTVFAIPTYGFVAVVLAMIGWGGAAAAHGRRSGRRVGARSASPPVQPRPARRWCCSACARSRQGCTALTGVEAVSNGVPNFKPPKSRNAATTLAIMGSLTIAMFAGITALALLSHVHVADDPAQLLGAPAGYQQRTVIAQVAGAVFGYDSARFFLVQAFTAAILVLAANTAFNGFPILASILGEDGYLPAAVRPTRGPAGVQQRHRHPRRAGRAADRAFDAVHQPADPAVHHRRVRLVHAQPGRHGAALDPRR